MKYTGRFLRKRGRTGVYQPDDGWHRKWTYKVGWFGSGSSIHLMAMTDGMLTKEFTEEDLTNWIVDNDMVVMSRQEMLDFINSEHETLGNFAAS